MTSGSSARGIETGMARPATLRVALVGFGSEEPGPLVAAIAEMGYLSHLFSPQSRPPVNEVDWYSAVILNLTSELTGSPWIADPQSTVLNAPLLAIGTCDDVKTFAAIEFNACEVLIRPFTTAELAVRLRRCIARSDRMGDKDSTGRAPRAVIADDDAWIVSLISGVLRGRGFDCSHASDGRHALELGRTLLPDLMILDLNMPFMNGFDVLTSLRRDPCTSAMTILMLTASDRQEDVVRGIELGASGYLCKPFRPFDFALRVKELVPGLWHRSTEAPQLNSHWQRAAAPDSNLRLGMR